MSFSSNKGTTMWRNVQGNKGSAIPRRVIVFDTETRPYILAHQRRAHVHKLRLGVAQKFRWRAGRESALEELCFREAGQFWQFAVDGARDKETTWIVAHSLLFDLRMVDLTGILDREEFVIDKPRVPRDPNSRSDANRGGRALAVLQGPPTIICIRHVASGAKFLCVDTLNWLRVPLAMIGKALGLPKLDMPDFMQPDRQWFTYCRRDVEITRCLFVRLMTWVDDSGLGNFGKTIAQQAMNAFRHRWIRHKIVMHDERDVQELERSGYFGGRTECFRLGELDWTCHQYDVNALYPSVMHCERYPCKLLRWETRADYMELPPAGDPARMVARVRLRPNASVYPARTKRGTLYPLGEFETTLCGPELLRATLSGEITGWESWAEYELRPIFAQATGELWKWRKDAEACGDDLIARLCKLLANSLYGKFGQRRVEWMDDHGAIAPEAWHQWIELDESGLIRTECRSVGWHVQRKTDRGNVAGAFVAIAAFVTAHGRCRMNELRKSAGTMNVFYQGVDSLIVNNAGRRHLSQAGEIAPSVLGKMRHEVTVPGAYLRNVNDYTLGEIDTVAGVSGKAQKLGPGHYREERFVTAGDLFSSDRADGVLVEQIESIRSGEYFKRKVNDDGQTQAHSLYESNGTYRDH